MEGVTIVTPSRETLLKSTGPIKCPEKNCLSVLGSESHLTMHLAKTHKMERLLKKDDVKRLFHCPERDCNYNTKLHFKQLKSLKQHYVKVHAERNRVCELCGKAFSAELALKYHEEYCGTLFKCTECNTSYPCYESLQTHCRRKKHVLYQKTAYKNGANNNLKASKSDSNICNETKTLLPRRSDTFLILIASKEGLDKSCQTDLQAKPQVCVETQTIGDFIPLKQTNSDSERISAETQTKTVSSETKSCNTSEKLNLEDYACGDVLVVQKTSSTQTNVNKNDALCNQALMDFDTTFFNCNMETQTDLFSDPMLNNCDFYANMYTQTPSCDDMLLDGLEFNNTYTQTAFYDDVRSVESQTMLYNNYKKGLLMCRDVANIETQTDLEAKQILEEIV